MEVSAAASLVTSQLAQTFNTPVAGGENSAREVRQDGDTDDTARPVQQTGPAAGTTESLGNNINVKA